MDFGHKKLDVYRRSMDYVRWVYDRVDRMNGVHRHARDQLLRASQSIPLNIAEGNGKLSAPDRCRFFGIARGSALECAAIQDVLLVGQAISEEEYQHGEQLLLRIVAMLTKMTQRAWSVEEEQGAYGEMNFGHDHDHDHDHEKHTTNSERLTRHV